VEKFSSGATRHAMAQSMSGRVWFVWLLPLLLLCGAEYAAASSQTQVAFQPDSEVFPNPERGFYTWTDFNYLDFSNVRAQGDTLTRPYIRLDAYRTTSLPQFLLDQLTAGFQEARRAGIKVIPRFSYNFAVGDPDATETQILLHLQQLAPILAANEDVIAAVEAGFIGAWGEWHHSTNGTDSPSAEAAIVKALMSAVPSSRMIAIRYPADLRRLQGTGPITPGEAFTGTLRARLGSHQDCFLASDDDWGTWGLSYEWATQTWKPSGYSIKRDKAYIAQNGRYAVVGGETCNVNPRRSNCKTALSELKYLHGSYLNRNYEPNVIQRFKDGGCFDEINRRLGYRYELSKAAFTSTIAQGEEFQLRLQLVNRGFAAMYNARPVFAVLRCGPQEYTFHLNVDPRYWAPGATTKFSASFQLPSDIEAGTCTLALWMPDQAISLRDNPLYSVRFANQGVWDATEGYNVISRNVVITAPGSAPQVITSKQNPGSQKPGVGRIFRRTR
jgi:hypothetical protein